ncbi:MAG: hypothetical protein RLN75_01705 [Longimicrobiales bacterium]
MLWGRQSVLAAVASSSLLLGACSEPTGSSPTSTLASLWPEAEIVVSHWPHSQEVFLRFAVVAVSCAKGKSVEVDVSGLNAVVRPFYLTDSDCVERGAVIQTHEVTIDFEAFGSGTVVIQTAGEAQGEIVSTNIPFELTR